MRSARRAGLAGLALGVLALLLGALGRRRRPAPTARTPDPPAPAPPVPIAPATAAPAESAPAAPPPRSSLGRRRAARVAALAPLCGAMALIGSALAPGPARQAPAVGPEAVVGGAAPLPGALRPMSAGTLEPSKHETRWAAVRRATIARAAPRIGARRVTRVGRRTPEGTTNIVIAARRVRRAGRVWVRVRLPSATGWVPRSALGGYGVVRTRLVVDRARLTATLLRDGRPVFRSRVAVGTAGSPTPRGSFYVRDRLTRYASPTYGPVAFGTSATSSTLTDWPAGGFIGIHGTDRPDLVPGRVSHGCIRMRNRDILRLARLMPVGTPVTIA
jgi:lipoprotein-anchoring transpeptidase ErfK/SrfK